MFKLTVIDDDRWIAEGIACYFSEKHIRVNILTEGHGEEMFRSVVGSDVIISEISACGLDVQALIELLATVKNLSPSTRLIILTNLEERAITGYICSALPGIKIVSKRSDITLLANEIFGSVNNCTLQQKTTFSMPKNNVLTQREFGLLRLLATHRTLTDIGRVLRLSCKTVSHHRKSIIRKLNCSSITELPPLLERLGFYKNQ